MKTAQGNGEDFERFLQMLEKKVGRINRKDSESMKSIKEIMENKIKVFGDLFVD